MSESKIVAAVGIASQASPLHAVDSTDAAASARYQAARQRSKKIEAAMSQAVLDACAEGLNVDTDAVEVRARMMAARQRVIDEENLPPAAVSVDGAA
jgi:hypothetical protein